MKTNLLILLPWKGVKLQHFISASFVRDCLGFKKALVPQEGIHKISMFCLFCTQELHYGRKDMMENLTRLKNSRSVDNSKLPHRTY